MAVRRSPLVLLLATAAVVLGALTCFQVAVAQAPYDERFPDPEGDVVILVGGQPTNHDASQCPLDIAEVRIAGDQTIDVIVSFAGQHPDDEALEVRIELALPNTPESRITWSQGSDGASFFRALFDGEPMEGVVVQRSIDRASIRFGIPRELAGNLRNFRGVVAISMSTEVQDGLCFDVNSDMQGFDFTLAGPTSTPTAQSTVAPQPTATATPVPVEPTATPSAAPMATNTPLPAPAPPRTGTGVVTEGGGSTFVLLSVLLTAVAAVTLAAVRKGRWPD